MTTEIRSHREQTYRTRAATELSWYQSNVGRSCELIAATGVSRTAPILDVGAGASLLVDALLEKGYSDLTVLDVVRDDADTIAAEFGDGLVLFDSVTETHVTPAGQEQAFLYCRFRVRPVEAACEVAYPRSHGASGSERA